MNGNSTKMDRRSFLKFLGAGAAGSGLSACDLPSTVTIEEGVEDVVAYVSPEEYVIPGIGVWYATTCLQCAAACGLHGRVREGRVLKMEGNPAHPLNHGKSCMMGQAAVQTHYNPNRVRQPLLRKEGKLVPISWEQADTLLAQHLGAEAQLAPNSVVWFTGTVSGHQRVLIENHLEALGSSHHYSHEVIATPVWDAVAYDMLGDENPQLAIGEARSILSFGADFLATWQSPVHFATEYAQFRRKDRGVLMVAESKMSLTGANADLWLAVKPGAEGVLALGLANQLLALGRGAVIPESLRTIIKGYTVAKASQISGVSEQRIEQIAKTLLQHSPSLILAGAPVEGQINGYQATAAVMLLNVILGNMGKTIIPRGNFPQPRLLPKKGHMKALSEFIAVANEGKVKVALIHGANPVYSAPAGLNIKSALDKIAFKVQLVINRDETTSVSDLVLPMHSALEDWGTHVAAYQAGKTVIGIQQPLMEPLYKQTRGFGDTLLNLLKMRKVVEAQAFDDYYAYLQNAVANLLNLNTGGSKAFWTQSLQDGLITVDYPKADFTPKLDKVTLQGIENKPNDVGLTLLPSPRLGLWDGRHANIPWLQEAPDQINKVVWDSWAEIHPKTAAILGIEHGDVIEVKTSHSSIRVKAFLFRGIHPNAIAVPLGQGHNESYGQFAAGIGINPLQILDPALSERETAHWAMYAQPVHVTRIGKGKDKLVRMGAVDTQHGRKISSVISADQYRRTEGDQS